jgi:hypothetical protein
MLVRSPLHMQEVSGGQYEIACTLMNAPRHRPKSPNRVVQHELDPWISTTTTIYLNNYLTRLYSVPSPPVATCRLSSMHLF